MSVGFIVRSIGSHEDSKFFELHADAMAYARGSAGGDVECTLVYEWSGDLKEGLAAAKAGRLQEIAHIPHREARRAPPPEPPLRLSKEADEFVAELVKKMPKFARKF
jgi:hypothetical protein